jgi:hypothetical protein
VYFGTEYTFSRLVLFNIELPICMLASSVVRMYVCVCLIENGQNQTVTSDI